MRSPSCLVRLSDGHSHILEGAIGHTEPYDAVISRVSHQSDHGVLVTSLVEHCALYTMTVRKGRASRWRIIQYFANIWRCGDIAELYLLRMSTR